MTLFDWVAMAEIGDVCLMQAGPDQIAILRVPPAFYCINLSTKAGWVSSLNGLFGPAYFEHDTEVQPAMFVLSEKGGEAG